MPRYVFLFEAFGIQALSKIKFVLMRLTFWECGKEDKKMSSAEEKYSRVRGWREGMQPPALLYRSVKKVLKRQH